MSGVCWIQDSHGRVPKEAVLVGGDKDGSPLYVGRAYYNSDILPAKIVPNHKAAYVSVAGREHKVTHYEVLCNRVLMWVAASGRQVPDDALQAGTTSVGEALYVGRVFHDGILTPGKVHPSHGVCYIPYDGRELVFKKYEVLVVK